MIGMIKLKPINCSGHGSQLCAAVALDVLDLGSKRRGLGKHG